VWCVVCGVWCVVCGVCVVCGCVWVRVVCVCGCRRVWCAVCCVCVVCVVWRMARLRRVPVVRDEGATAETREPVASAGEYAPCREVHVP